MAKMKRRRMEPIVVAEEAIKYGFTPPKTMPKGERFISPNEAAKILNITGEAVKQWIYLRRLPAVKLSNGYWKVRITDLENFVKARQDLGQRRILIVDQAGATAQELIQAVTTMGNESVIAHNMADAMLKAADLLPNLFVINLAVNPTEAWSLIEKVRKHRSLRRMAVLLVANSDLNENESARALDLGVQGMLKRPITSKLLQEEIAKILTRVM